MPTLNLKVVVVAWRKQKQTKKVKNKTYKTHGRLCINKCDRLTEHLCTQVEKSDHETV